MKGFRKFALLLAVIVAVTSMPVAAGATEGDAADSYSAAVREEISADTGDGGESGQADQTDSEQTENGGSVSDEDSGKVTDSDKDTDDPADTDGTSGTSGESGDNDDPAADPEEGTGRDENTGDGTDSEDPGAEPDGNAGEEPGTDDPADPAEPVTPAVTVKLNTTSHIRYMNGSSDGMFYPSSALTRAEAAQMIYSLLQGASAADVVQSVSFSDVASDAWYAEAVNNLAKYGVLNGSGGTFRPDSFISRAEFVAMLSKFFYAGGIRPHIYRCAGESLGT